MIAHACDRLTYTYVRDNTFARNSNQINCTNHQNNLQELSDHQNELLKIPLNAVRISFLTFIPLMILPVLIFVIGDNVILPITKLQMGTIIFCTIQSLKIIIILTCLHKATEANQAEISQAKRRADRQEWERLHSFKAKQLRHQHAQNSAQASEPQPGTSLSGTQCVESLPPPKNQRQILDPELLEAIIEEETSV